MKLLVSKAKSTDNSGMGVGPHEILIVMGVIFLAIYARWISIGALLLLRRSLLGVATAVAVVLSLVAALSTFSRAQPK